MNTTLVVTISTFGSNLDIFDVVQVSINNKRHRVTLTTTSGAIYQFPVDNLRTIKKATINPELLS